MSTNGKNSQSRNFTRHPKHKASQGYVCIVFSLLFLLFYYLQAKNFAKMDYDFSLVQLAADLQSLRPICKMQKENSSFTMSTGEKVFGNFYPACLIFSIDFEHDLLMNTDIYKHIVSCCGFAHLGIVVLVSTFL